MMADKSQQIEVLIDKAAKAEKSEEALRFSQAACNVANALCAAKNTASNNLQGAV